jgi:HPt (histidine-containing phosphotransfer) domain-containing protein
MTNPTIRATTATSREANPFPAINWEHLHQICDNNQEFELELLQTFIDDSEIHLEEMETAISLANFDSLEHQAHHIKGASANVGLDHMHVIAAELEAQARQQKLEGAQQRLSLLQQSLKDVQAFLCSQ